MIENLLVKFPSLAVADMSDNELRYVVDEFDESSDSSEEEAGSDSDVDMNLFRPSGWSVPIGAENVAATNLSNARKRVAEESVLQAETRVRMDTPYPGTYTSHDNDVLRASAPLHASLPNNEMLQEGASLAPIPEVSTFHASAIEASQVQAALEASAVPETATAASSQPAPATPRNPHVQFSSTPQVINVPAGWMLTPIRGPSGYASSPAFSSRKGKQRYAYHQRVDSGFGSVGSSPATTGDSSSSSNDTTGNNTAYINELLNTTGNTTVPVARCVLRPKKFKGKNWNGYKWHFLAVAQVNGWSPEEAARMLKACLDDSVALVLKRALRQDDVTIHALFKALDERYNVPGPDYVLKGKVRRTMQRPGQTVDQYQMELVKVLSGRLDTDESEVALEQFIFGLSDPRMAKYVAKRYPDDLHDALKFAREYEETSTWMGNVGRSKRIGYVGAEANNEPPTTRQDTARQSSTTQTQSASEQMAALIKRVDELSARGQQYRHNDGRGRGNFSGRNFYGRNGRNRRWFRRNPSSNASAESPTTKLDEATSSSKSATQAAGKSND